MMAKLKSVAWLLALGGMWFLMSYLRDSDVSFSGPVTALILLAFVAAVVVVVVDYRRMRRP